MIYFSGRFSNSGYSDVYSENPNCGLGIPICITKVIANHNRHQPIRNDKGINSLPRYPSAFANNSWGNPMGYNVNHIMRYFYLKSWHLHFPRSLDIGAIVRGIVEEGLLLANRQYTCIEQHYIGYLLILVHWSKWTVFVLLFIGQIRILIYMNSTPSDFEFPQNRISEVLYTDLP